MSALDAASASRSAAVKACGCRGWEVLCPDGRIRQYPFANEDDAEGEAELCSRPLREGERCDQWATPGELVTSQPPCPGGKHTIRPLHAS